MSSGSVSANIVRYCSWTYYEADQNERSARVERKKYVDRAVAVRA
jgi:hypothetical protein